MIIQFEIEKDRYNLGFKDEILKNFIFLINEYGYKCVKTEVTFVRYESDKVFINFYHGRGSYILGFEIGFINKDKSKETYYTLTEIMRLYENNEFVPYQITKYEVMVKFVPRMAELIKQYAIKAIVGDKTFYKKLSKVRSDWFKKYMINKNFPKADDAWRKKNYKEFIKILYPYKDDLTGAIKKKYEYALKNKNGM